MLHPCLTVREAGIANQLRSAYDSAKISPFVIIADRDHAPAIIAMATKAAVRRRRGIPVTLRLRIMAIHRCVQIGDAEGFGGRLDLRQIDRHSLPRQATAEQRSNYDRRPHDKA